MYNVAVDRAAMREEILGPLFQRHVVSLSGTVDQRWLESFEAVQNDSDQFQRYRLDPQKGLVSFTCRASDGPGCPLGRGLSSALPGLECATDLSGICGSLVGGSAGFRPKRRMAGTGQQAAGLPVVCFDAEPLRDGGGRSQVPAPCARTDFRDGPLLTSLDYGGCRTFLRRVRIAGGRRTVPSLRFVQRGTASGACVDPASHWRRAGPR